MTNQSLPKAEEIDFHYLLSLMQPLSGLKEFAWLPELFSIIGHESLILLCKYAGGETITIPTLKQLSDSIEALQLFYDVFVAEKMDVADVNVTIEVWDRVLKVKEVYDAQNN